ncbi:hypothetical protein SAMN02745126_01551 [Enhydrobacter aerosaccus]|uniref:Lipoprotein n=1 Tax=Enhydrobacter aerosaccus TaxID=225324 RepID=A0A1T4LHL6_9HYPH|nr:hypothetical protein [Enhydrobacter aerosaccus]SJZ54203.1 hypothetical protein SAMN02745126_01551 [Enhydrobacter aerosaccus]
MVAFGRFAARAAEPVRVGAFVGVLLVLLSACSNIKSSHSELLVKPPARIQVMSVVVDPNHAVPTKVSTVVPRYANTAAEQGSSSYTAQIKLQEIARLLVTGFRTRFPVLAVPYGVRIAPTADNVLHVRIESSETNCGAGKCTTTVTIEAKLLDAGGQTLWRSSIEFGQASSTVEINDVLFDAVAVQLLDGMKKDGVIGG